MWNQIKVEAPYLKRDNLDINFFNGKPQKKENVILIFGRNGSGKTTISSAVTNSLKENSNSSIANNISDNEPSNIASFYEVKENGTCVGPINISSEESNHVFVYNQSFINNKAKIGTNENLDAIIRLRDQQDLQEKYDDLKEEKDKVTKEKINENDCIEKLKDKTISGGPEFYRIRIEDELKKTGKWSETAGKIDDNKINKRVTLQIINNIRTIDSTLNKSNVRELQLQLNDLIKNIELIRKSTPLKKYSIKKNPNDENVIRTVIMEKLPALNDDEYKRRLTNTMGNITSITPTQRIELFSDSEVTYCPTCLRDITDEEKNKIIEVAKDVLNDFEKEEYVKRLNNIDIKKIEEANIPSETFNRFPEDVTNLKSEIDAYNDNVVKMRESLKSKKENPYGKVKMSEISIDSIYRDIKEAGESLNLKIDDDNKKFSNLGNLQVKARKLNDEIAAIELQPNFKDLEGAEKKLKDSNDQFKILESRENELERNIQKVKSDMNGQEIALQDINKMLAYVFMDSSRIVLEEGENCYRILSKGEPVPLKSLSTGEQNAISLCYFFSTINENLNKKNEYSKNNLVILDDPISSFDYENKVGILSLIDDKLKNILFGNENSKVIIMTHDFEMFNHLDKIIDNISQYQKKLNKKKSEHGNDGESLENGKKIRHDTISKKKYVLESGDLKPLDKNYTNDYKHELNVIYKYALDDDDSILDSTIGNRMRRVVEGFATFCYNTSSRGIFTDPEILRLLNDDELITFYSSFLSRLVLDNGSHLQNKVEGITDSDWIGFVSHEELLKTARCIILFIYKVNYLHIVKNVKNFDSEEVESWESIIKPKVKTSIE